MIEIMDEVGSTFILPDKIRKINVEIKNKRMIIEYMDDHKEIITFRRQSTALKAHHAIKRYGEQPNSRVKILVGQREDVRFINYEGEKD